MEQTMTGIMELAGAPPIVPPIANLKWKTCGSTLWIGTLAEFHYSIRLGPDNRYVLCVKGEDMPGVADLQDAKDHAQHHMETRILEEIFNVET
jgi:hypothetical protein